MGMIRRKERKILLKTYGKYVLFSRLLDYYGKSIILLTAKKNWKLCIHLVRPVLKEN